MSWPAEWTAEIGQAVRRTRDRLGLSAEQLSARCRELGFAIPRNTITNLELGRKATMPLHELAVLARALELPPVDLLYPVGRAAAVEHLPGAATDPFSAAEWFCGLRPLDSDSLERQTAAYEALTFDSAVGLYRAYVDAVQIWLEDRGRLQHLAGDERALRDWRRIVDEEAKGIRRLHARCLELEVSPPVWDEETAAQLEEVLR